MHKKAVFLHGLVAGAAGHLGANALSRHAHHATNIAEVLAHQGFQHGAAGGRMAPAAARSIKALFGPEALIPYELAHQAGKAHYALPPAMRAAAAHGAQGAHVGGIPTIPAVQRALLHDALGTAPTLHSKTLTGKLYGKVVSGIGGIGAKPFQTKGQRVVSNIVGAAPAAALAAADPLGAAVHMGWNGVREATAYTPIGQQMIKQQLLDGLRGKGMSRAKEVAADYVFSPAFLDAQRAGMAVHARDPKAGHYLAAKVEGAAPKARTEPLPVDWMVRALSSRPHVPAPATAAGSTGA